MLAVVSWLAFAQPQPELAGPIASGTSTPDDASGSETAHIGERRSPAERSPAASRPQSGASARPASDLPVFAADRGLGAIRGIVLDPVGAPRAGVAVTAAPYQGRLPPLRAIGDDRDGVAHTTTGDDGSFTFADLAEGPVRVQARQDGAIATATTVVSAIDPRPPLELRLREPRTYGEDVRVRVTTEGQPAIGVTVELFGRTETTAVMAPIPVEPFATATTDDDGVARFVDRGVESAVAFATAADGRAGWSRLVSMDPDPVEVTIALMPTGSIEGRVVGLPPEELAGAVAEVHALNHTHAYYAGSGRRYDVPLDGDRFAIAGIPPGTYGLHLTSPRGLRIVYEPPSRGESRMENAA